MSTILEIVLSAVNEASGPLREVRGDVDSVLGSVGGLMQDGLDPLSDMLGTGLKVAADGAAAALGGLVALGGKGISLAAGFEQTQVAFETMLGSGEKAKMMMQQLFDFSAKTPFQFEQVSGAAKQLVAFGVSADDAQGVLKRLGDIASGVGMPLGDIAQIYGKIKSQGKVTGETIMQLGGRGVPIVAQLAKVFGVSSDKIAKMVSEGKIGFPEFEKALAGMTDTGGQFAGMMEKQSQTVNGLWSSLQDNVDLALAGIGKSLIDNLNIKEVMGSAIDLTGQWGKQLQEMAGQWLPVVVTSIKSLAEQWLPPIIQLLKAWWAAGVDLVRQIPTLVGWLAEWGSWILNLLQPLIDWIAQAVSLKDVLSGFLLIVGVIAAQAFAAFVVAWAPVAAVIATAIAVASLLRHAWEGDWGGIRTLVTDALAWIESRFTPTLNAIKSFGWEAIAEITGWGTDVHPAISGFWTIVSTALGGLPEIMIRPLAFVTERLPQWTAVLGQWGLAAWRGIADAVPLVEQHIREWYSTLSNYVIDKFPAWRTSLMNFSVPLWDWIVQETPVALQHIQGWYNALAGYIANNLPAWTATISRWSSALWDWIGRETPVALDKLGLWATSLWDWIGTRAPAWLEKFAPWGIALFKWIGDNIPKAIDALTQWVDGIFAWNNTTGKSKAQEMIARLGEAFLDALGKVGIALGRLALTVTGDLLLKFAQGLLNWLGIDVNMKAMHGHLIEILGDLSDALTGKAALLGGLLAAALVPGLLGIATSILGTVIPAIGSLVVTLGGGIIGAIGSLASFFSTLLLPALTALASFVMDVAIPALVALLAPFAPIIAIVAAVAAAAAALYLAWDTNFLGIRDKTYQAFDYIKGIFTNFPATLDTLKQRFSEWGSSALNKVSEGFASAKDFVAGQLNQVITDVQNQGIGYASGALLGRMYEGGRNFLMKMSEGINAAAPNLKTDLGNALAGARDAVSWWHDNLLPHFLSSAKDLAASAATGLGSIDFGRAINDNLANMRDVYNKWHDDLVPHFFGSMQYMGKQGIDGLAKGIRDSFQTLKDALDLIATIAPDWVKEKLGIHSPSRVFLEMGQNVIEGFTLGMESLKGQPRMLLDDIGNSLTAQIGHVNLATDGGAGASNTYNNQRTNNFNINVPGGGSAGANQEILNLLRTLTAVYAN
ncbi:MAG: tape measure protein [Caldilineaceae bacterium]